jgi:hypothetical protein
MPRRHSAEERAGSFYRADRKALKPPPGLTPVARRIWREIVASKPVDWFHGDQLHELASHVENRARLIDLRQRLAAVDVGSKEFRELAVNMKIISTSVATSARQLRLTVQAAAERHAAKIIERASPEPAGDDLLGGAAVRARPKRVA